MKVIISRKGFDSSSGGYPSPVLPDGTMVSLPIPDPVSEIRYRDLVLPDGQPYSTVMASLGIRRPGPDDKVHLDPDICPSVTPREHGWRPLFGQEDASQSHLVNQGVGPGDLFLFFGLFRQTVQAPDGLKYARGATEFHSFWGYMQVGETIKDPPVLRKDLWAAKHPHVIERDDMTNNAVYVAAPNLSLDRDLPGAGTFRYSAPLRLTSTRDEHGRPNDLVSVWDLPSCLHPDACGSILSYHRKPSRWSRAEDRVLLRSVGRGQEFVLEADADILDWVKELIRQGSSPSTKS